MNFFKIYKHLLFFFPAELSHKIAVVILKNNFITKPQQFIHQDLAQKIAGINFANPVGLAAGFDKNAEMIKALAKFNFGFLEVGTVTPKPQLGNKKPRLFRLTKDKAIINRMGFNNVGAVRFKENFNKNYHNQIPIGINIGKNKTSKSSINDYLELIEYFYELADYITINISSPNTPQLRDLQKIDVLEEFINKIDERRNLLGQKKLFLKIAPDVSQAQLENICNIVIKYKINALIISNTTITRNKLTNPKYQNEEGGLSGKPLFKLSNQVISSAYQILQGKVPIIGVGGISNAQDAYHKIKLGANLIQLYSALIFEGLNLVTEINQELVKLLKDDGFPNIGAAVGTLHK